MTRDGSTTVSYRALFCYREFSALFCADTVSRTGSQLGKVALAALVYERTDSPGLAAATFAISYLPGLLGGPLLGTLADRLPRRTLLVTCDLLRAVLTAAIAFLPLPVPVALVILLAVELIRVPFGAARIAILADILDGERFTAGNALVGACQQAVQVLGFGLGGFVALAIGPRAALAADAATYGLSAIVVITLVQHRSAPTAGGDRPGLLRDAVDGLRVVVRTRRMPTLFVLLFIGPTALGAAEGLAMSYGYELGGGQALGGLLLAAAPLGSVFGLAWYGRMSVPTRERRLIGSSLLVGVSIAAAGGGSLLASSSSAPIVLFALFLAGLGMGHMAHLQASIVQSSSANVRGRVIGLANTVLQLGQAIAVLLAGVVAEAGSISVVLCGTGCAAAASTLLVVAFGAPHAARHRAERRHPRHVARQHPRLPRSQQLTASTPFEQRPAGPPANHPPDAVARTEPDAVPGNTGESVQPTPLPGRTLPSPLASTPRIIVAGTSPHPVSYSDDT